MTRTRWYSRPSSSAMTVRDAVGALARGPHRHAAGAVALRDAHVRLQGGVVDARRAGGARHEHGAGRVRALAALDLVLVERGCRPRGSGRRSRASASVRREQRRQLLVLDVDQRRGRLGGRLAGRHDRRDAVADEADVLAEERLVDRALLPGVDPGAAVRVLGELRQENTLTTPGQRLGARRVDALDHAVGDRAEQRASRTACPASSGRCRRRAHR